MPPKRSSLSRSLSAARKKKREIRNSSTKQRTSQGKKRQNAASHCLAKTATSNLPAPHDLGNMTFKCTKCGAFMWKHETHNGPLKSPMFSTCCSQGKIDIPHIIDPPELLQKLLTESTADAKNFRQNIRAYNSSFAFTSMGVHQDLLPPGTFVFRIRGAIYHRIGHILPNEGEPPRFSQIYIHDNEVDNRVAWNTDLKKETVATLQEMLHNTNPFIEAFKNAAEMVTNDPLGTLKIVLQANPQTDLRRYNIPTASEIAAIIPNGSENQPANRDVVLYRRTENSPSGHNLQHINETHPQYDPLQYVLILPHGRYGWTTGMHLSNIQQVSPMQFYSFHLMQRDNFNVLLRCGRLFHQYIVDQYAKMERERLNFCFHHQQDLRAELYCGLSDAVANGDASGASVGTRIILPSSFCGGPRNMHQLYQDTMAIVRGYGKPDLFITFTCNPNWSEIKTACLQNQCANDRPDIITRVFKGKPKALMCDITEKGIFGRVQAFVYTIEFQKRGLPHAHILVILQSESKLKTTEDYDKIVSAEIPLEEGTLRQLVIDHMIHGPCGLANPKCPCMEDGKCTKRFPKDFRQTTCENSDGYPQYRRRDDGLYVIKKVYQ